MSDSDNTEAGLREEVAALRARVAALESERTIWMQAEESLRESVERFRTLFENAPIGVYRTTPDGRILNANPALVKMLGYSSFEELAARNLEEQGFEPQYPRSEFCKRMELEGRVEGMEAAWKRRDGSVLFVRENAKAIRGTDGQNMYYEGTIEDITEAKRAEEALRTSEESFRAIAENIPGLVFSYDFHPDGRRSLLYVGPGLGKLIGETTAVAIGDDVDRFFDLIHPADREILCETSEAAAAAGRPFDQNYRVRAESGDYRWVRSIARPTRRSGDVIRWHGVLVDISAQMQAEAALREAHDQLEQRVVQRTADLTAANRRLQEEITDRKLAEEALRKSESHLRNVLDGLGPHLFVGVMSTDGVLLEANRPGLEVAGLKAEDVLGQPCEETYWFAYSETVKRQLREDIRRAAQGETCRHDMVVRVGEDQFIDVDFCLRPLMDKSGAITHLIPSAAVITERKRTEEALRKSEHRYRAIVEVQTELVCRWLPGGVHTFVNDAYCRCFGKRREELLGCSLMTLIPKEEHQQTKAHFDSLNRENPIASHEHHVIAQDGQIRWHQWTDRAIFDEAGRVVEYQSVGRDITERRLAEEALRASEERYRAIVEDQTEFVCRSLPDTTLTFVNETYARYFGSTPDELIGKRFLRLIPEEDREGVTAYFSSLDAEHPIASHEHRVVRSGGEIRWQQWSNRAILDEHGNVVEIQSVGRDITEQKRAEEALRESEELFRTVVGASNDAVVAIDEEGLITVFNPAAEKMFGREKEQLVGQPLDFLMPESYRERHQQDVIGFFTKGEPHGAIDKTLELPAMRADGGEFPIELSLSIGRRGDEPFVLAVIRDITERKKAEEALRESERKSRAILDHTFQFIGLMTPDGTLIEANRSALNFAGIEESDVLGRPFWKTHWWTHSVELQGRLRGAVRDAAAGHFVRFEATHPAADGSFHTVDFSLKPVMDESGNVVLLIPEGRDITERKQAEEELSKFKTISDRSPHGNAIADLDGILLYVNRAFAGMHGYTSEELMGKHLSILHTEDQMDDVNRLIARLKREGTFVSEEVWHKKRDDTVFPALMDAAIIADDQGTPLFLSATASDISDRKLAEEELRRQALVFNSINDGVIITDVQGRISDMNAGAEQIFGYFKDEVIGKSPELLNRPEEAKLITDSIREGILRDGYWSDELNFVRKDGFEGMCEAFLVPLHDESGEWIGTVAVNREVTARKQAEEERAMLEGQLRQAQKMEAVGTLASGIAHDFSNLLTAIFGYTDLAKATLPDGHTAAASLEMVEQSATQARGVINALLTFSHKKVAEKTPINLPEIVSDAVRLLRRFLPASIELAEELSAEPEIWVNGDATQLQQVVMNLAVNARDAMPQGGRLRIALSEDSGLDASRLGKRSKPHDADANDTPRGRTTAVLLVEDSGAGMSEETRSRVFEPFFTTKPRGQGTGLGLSVIHGIVADHKGRIGVDSRPEHGTRITVRLPCCAPPEKSDAKPPPPRSRKGNGELILVVEDSEHVRSIMTSTLRSQDYQVLPAIDGAQALKALDTHKNEVRLVVLDLDLPKTYELTLLQDMRQKPVVPPVVVITGRADFNPEEHLTDNETFLRKPFQMSDLTELVARSLAGTAAEDGAEQ